MSAKTKLELTWIGKDRRPRLEPRILVEEEALTHAASIRHSENDIFDNVLIHGDNLLALKSLESTHACQIRCIFIDPPYNTGSAFAQYDDGIEHSVWLSLMRDRLLILATLLSDDGSLWVSIDDNEMPYLRLLLDEVFGRQNFIATVVWQKRIGPDSRAVLGAAHDYIVVYAKSARTFTDAANSIALRQDQIDQFQNPDNDPRGPWTSSSNFSAQGFRKNQMYKIVTPGGSEYFPPEGRCWGYIESEYKKFLEEGRMWFGRDGKGMPRKKTYLSEREGQASWTWWPNNEVGNTQESKKESIALYGAPNAFATPKPERLLERIIQIATNPGELVLDSFAGSGTTGAVAHKMGRRWIMVELGDHCETHIVPRMRKVIDSADPGGITELVGWKGGGGYRYYRLAPSLMEKDAFGQWVISKAYNAEMLAEAMCKHFGFSYDPSPEHYWMQGSSSETDYIYVTTNSLTHEQLRVISDQVGPERTLLLCCKAFQSANADSFKNLTIRKIPGAVLDRCEWGKDDYSLKIANLPMAEDEPEPEPTPKAAGKTDAAQQSLFQGAT